MTAEKKKTLFRVILYTVLAYAPPFVLIPAFGYMKDTTASQLSLLLICFAPMLANILTRLLTKEGCKDLYLMPGKGHGHRTLLFYALALLPVIACTAGAICAFYQAAENKAVADTLRFLWEKDRTMTVTSFIQAVTFCLPLSFLYFGEEFGWRGYLTPKLEQLMPRPAALVVSGIIWGLWHAPMTWNGHNFGKDYNFFPWAGMLVMCVFCILVGCYFSYLQEKTNSVYPASIAHALNNNITGTVTGIMAAANPALMPADLFPFTVTAMIPMAVTGAVFMVLLLIGKKKA